MTLVSHPFLIYATKGVAGEGFQDKREPYWKYFLSINYDCLQFSAQYSVIAFIFHIFFNETKSLIY